MKTIHLANSNPHSSEFQVALIGMCDQVFSHSHQAKRIISCGAGVVILPETDKKHDCSPSELAKALHLREEMEKSFGTETTTYLAYNFSTEENHLIALTKDQIRLLEWLKMNDFICEDDIFTEIHSEIETI
jgi:hypothetical protein